jgi:cytidine deaminase
MCAERNAVASAVATEGKDIRITDIVVVTPDSDNCSPCGACRQVLAELAPSANIWFLKNGNLMCRGINYLLPDRFSLDLPAAFE